MGTFPISKYDPAALAALIDEALDPSVPAPVDGPRRQIRMADTPLWETLGTLLPNYLPPAQVATMLDELRTVLYQGARSTTLADVHRAVHACRRCPQVLAAPRLPFWNVADPDVLFVAESMFFLPEAAALLATVAKEAGLSSTRLGLTALTRCEPQCQRHTPSTEEIETCSRFLWPEIELISPKLIVTLGATVAETLVGTVKITEDRGRLFWIGAFPILITFSPTFALRSPQHRTSLAHDLRSAYTFCYGEEEEKDRIHTTPRSG